MTQSLEGTTSSDPDRDEARQARIHTKTPWGTKVSVIAVFRAQMNDERTVAVLEVVHHARRVLSSFNSIASWLADKTLSGIAVVGLGVATDSLTYVRHNDPESAIQAKLEGKYIITPVLPYRLQSLGYTGISSLTGWLFFSFSGGMCICDSACFSYLQMLTACDRSLAANGILPSSKAVSPRTARHRRFTPGGIVDTLHAGQTLLGDGAFAVLTGSGCFCSLDRQVPLPFGRSTQAKTHQSASR